MSKAFISSEEAGEVSAWQQPDVGSPGGQAMLTAEKLAEIERTAREEGFRQGREEGLQAGLEAGQAEVERRLALLDEVLETLKQPLQRLDETVEHDLVELALVVARQLIRRELKTQPDEIVAVIRGALAALPTGARDIRVHLNPEDAELVRALLPEGSRARAVEYIEDPSITRGGCRVESEFSRVDATLETRLNEVIAQVLGDERVPALDGDASMAREET